MPAPQFEVGYLPSASAPTTSAARAGSRPNGVGRPPHTRTELACLAGDVVASHPGVLTLPHEEGLRAALRMAVADHMRPLLVAIGPTARRGARSLWGMVADDLVSGIWYLGRMLGREGDVVRAATEVLPIGIPPYPAGAAFRDLVGDDGRRHVTRTRAGCCMFCAIRPAEACATCARTGDAERLRRLRG